MKNVPVSKLGNLYREHINLILKKDIVGLLNQYADDGLLISSFEKTPKYFRGQVELEKHFQGILGIDGLDTEIAFWAETENPNIKLAFLASCPFVGSHKQFHLAD